MNEVIEYNPNEQSGFALILPTTQPKDPFAALFNTAYHSADEKMHVLWMALRDAWLNTKLSKSGSEHTIRSYQTATVEWFDYLATQIKPDGSTVKAWEVTANHVRNWQNHLLNSRGLAPSSVNQRLAACSSFYSFVTRERGLVNEVEVTAFMDANGNNRSNPFAGSNVQRLSKMGDKLSIKQTLVASLKNCTFPKETTHDIVREKTKNSVIVTPLY
ncbi:MAG TPA: phage integrase N-terminal SAM-like domain-containing protein [Nitrospira sp.]|nr:phage integrase N-terminal SAM-like domain-containing protein [Nitrospira sp.]